MSIITRTIHNPTSVNVDLFVPGYDTLKPTIVVAPSATLDLFTVLTTDELETIQNQLTAFVVAGDLTVIATVDTTTFNPVGGATGTVNSGTANQLAYYASTGAAVSGLTAITASSALASNASGLPVASSTTSAELAFVHGVTSAIQTQLNAKQATISSVLSSASAGGMGATETLTVAGLLTTSTILAVSSSVAGANSLAIVAFGTPGSGTLSVTWTADPGAGAQVLVAFVA